MTKETYTVTFEAEFENSTGFHLGFVDAATKAEHLLRSVPVFKVTRKSDGKTEHIDLSALRSMFRTEEDFDR